LIISAISIFPELFGQFQLSGIIRKSFELGDVFSLYNPRDYVEDNYKRIDDVVFGGGPGMVMKIKPLEDALQDAKSASDYVSARKKAVIYVTPQGIPVNQKVINQLSEYDNLIFVCGRYEGIDERFIDRNVDLELSIGDFVVSGGELPVMLIMDAILRLRPNVLNSSDSYTQDSFMNGLLDCPHYTKPRDYEGSVVPDVLLSGNHQKIARWRLEQSLIRTWQRRPDLIEQTNLNKELSGLLQSLIKQEQDKG